MKYDVTNQNSLKSTEPWKQTERKYSKPFDKEERFGLTSKDKTEDGSNGKNGTKIGIATKENMKEATICDMSLSSWRNLNKHKLGTTCDPIQGTKHLSVDHTYGIKSISDNIKVSQIIHDNKFDDNENLSLNVESLVADLRKKLKVSGFRNFREFEYLLRTSVYFIFANFIRVLKILTILNINKILQLLDYRNGFHDNNLNVEIQPNRDISDGKKKNWSSTTSYSQYTKASQYGQLSKERILNYTTKTVVPDKRNYDRVKNLKLKYDLSS
ncbi:uncharacterized protein LOC115231592 [Octopus sinensis]|uniref:Uncharacterized protein LOC115231592 n=1 Tax=Octopus sinensis TaxID=2607531 RepID=A0A6P7U557_9MOLL|nr:uncharacterized protein LOC115231592 [Octopus sinensis]